MEWYECLVRNYSAVRTRVVSLFEEPCYLRDTTEMDSIVNSKNKTPQSLVGLDRPVIREALGQQREVNENISNRWRTL